MLLNVEGIEVKDCLTVGEFIKVVSERTGKTVTNQAIYHHLKEDSEILDYIEWSGMKLIVQNDKAEKFTPGSYYTGRPRTATKMQL